MIEAIHRLVTELRGAGLQVSPAEVIDAARAAQAVGIESRAEFHHALRATLAKTHTDTLTFDQVFTRLFTVPGPPKKPGRRGKGKDPSAGGEGRRSRPRPPVEEDRSVGAGRRPHRHEETPVRRRPGRLTFILQSKGQHPLVQPRRVMPGKTNTPAPRRARFPRRDSPHGESPMVEPRRLDLKGPISTERETLLAREIPRLIQEIRLRAGRRRRPDRRGRLWTARLMRVSAMTEGVPFVIPMRARRPRRVRLIVLADVSWSVLRVSSFFLQMASAFVLAPRGASCRVSLYLFVDSCVEATRAFARFKPDEGARLNSLIETLPLLNPRAASDYGRAFHQAAHSRHLSHAALRTGGRDTVLVVLGDARSNFGDPLAWAFEDLAARCRRVIWLVPEPMSQWNTGDSVLSEYMPFCDVVCEAGNLDGIAAGVAAMVRSL